MVWFVGTQSDVAPVIPLLPADQAIPSRAIAATAMALVNPSARRSQTDAHGRYSTRSLALAPLPIHR